MEFNFDLGTCTHANAREKHATQSKVENVVKSEGIGGGRHRKRCGRQRPVVYLVEENESEQLLKSSFVRRMSWSEGQWTRLGLKHAMA